MSLIRYQSRALSSWPSSDRWATLREELNNLFDRPAGHSTHQAQSFSGWAPVLDLYQNHDNVVALVELPGMQKEAIDISLHDGTLTIAGERAPASPNEVETAPRTERSSGKFRRSVTLPTRVDATKVSASYKDGLLTVTLPKAEEAKPKKVEVTIE